MGVAVILDLETLDTKPTSIVLSIGMLCVDSDKEYSFNELVDKGIEVKLNAYEQGQMGRTVSASTLTWWEKQGEEASRVLQPSDKDVSIVDLHSIIKNYLEKNGYDYRNTLLYCRGQSFDFPILENLFEETLKGSQPFNSWKARDTRTVIDTLLGTTTGLFNMDEPAEFVKHNALHDCAMDFLRMQEAVSIFIEE
jgi:hypothetical protein